MASTRDLLQGTLTESRLVSLTNQAVKADQDLNQAKADLDVRNLQLDRDLSNQASIASEANKSSIQTTATITKNIAQKEKELQELDSGNKAYRTLYMIPGLNIIPAIIDSNIESKRDEITRYKETLESVNAATIAQDNNLTLQTKLTGIQKAVTSEQFISAFQAKQDNNAEIAAADKNFQFLKNKLEAETEKLRQAQIGQSMQIARQQASRETIFDQAKLRLMTLQGDQAQASLKAFEQNESQLENVVDSYNKSTGSNLDVTSFKQLPDTQRTFIIQSQTGLLRTPEDMWSAWQASGFTNKDINLIPAGMRDQIGERTKFQNRVEREFYTAQGATDSKGVKVKEQLNAQFGEVDPKTGAYTGKLDYDKVNANFQDFKADEIASSSGLTFITNPSNAASREVTEVMKSQNKLPDSFDSLVKTAVETSQGMDYSEDKTLSVISDVIEKALAEQKARSTELGLIDLSPLVATYPESTFFGFGSTTNSVALTDSNGNIDRVKLKELTRGYKAAASARANAGALTGNASSFQILENYRNQQRIEQDNQEANRRAIAGAEQANRDALNNQQ